ncbi:siphovirus Gp157 family protein [uncultured Desulfovibrio sp.]|uniref:siphovirus Gp157 family protein n=1 Tax=uncultured Desulfovibrio sp. TaxID=167968 RepID=UPI00262E6B56|nr:siphovirus Gp157 family protein [uncultured Desulfovibrio sp.]
MPTFDQIQQEISSMISLTDEELTDEQRKTLNAYLDELGQQEAEKVDGFGQFIRLESARVEALKTESKRLAARAKTAESRIAYLKGRYAAIMHDNGLKKIQGNAYTISTRESTSVVVPEDISQLDDIFLRRKETVEADKTVIKEHLERGMTIPGCALKTSIGLQIR